MTFSGERLRIARQRRKLTGRQLAELAGLTAVTVSKAENGHRVEDATAMAFAEALDYPIDFFGLESPPRIPADIVSFRSLAKMGAADRDAALAAGAIGVELYEWVAQRFNLPSPDLIDLSKERNKPETAARLLRQHWGIGDRPIGNMLALLESKGVRILSLSENTKSVDAYSFWKAEHPYIFLNQKKTPERSVFDCAHELGHLVLHLHAGSRNDKGAEYQADAFASAFLMPEADVKNEVAGVTTATQVIRYKGRWRVSAMALAYRLHKLRLISDWNYRSICIDLGKRGYRSSEPDGIEREKSVVWEKVLIALWSRKLTKNDVAVELSVPFEELESLIFELAGPTHDVGDRSKLRLVG